MAKRQNYILLYKLPRSKQANEQDYNSQWLDMIESELASMGMNDIWLNEGMGFNSLYIKESVKRRLKDNFMQNWSASVDCHEYCESYRLIKSDFGMEKYLTSLSFFHRTALSKWRCRSNNLPIANSRFELDDSILCPFCPDIVGDEYHYFFVCKFFQEERIKFMGTFLPDHYNWHTYSNLMNSNDTEILRKIANYTSFVMDIFKNKNLWDKSFEVHELYEE